MTSANLFSKGWKFLTTITKHFYMFLLLIPSDKFWRNFCIFPWRNCGRKIRDFKSGPKFAWVASFDRLSYQKKEFEFKQVYLKATLHFKRMLSETKQKFFWATKFCRANAPKKLLLDFTQHSKPTYFFCLHFHREPMFYMYSQKDVSFLRPSQNTFTNVYP